MPIVYIALLVVSVLGLTNEVKKRKNRKAFTYFAKSSAEHHYLQNKKRK